MNLTVRPGRVHLLGCQDSNLEYTDQSRGFCQLNYSRPTVWVSRERTERSGRPRVTPAPHTDRLADALGAK